MSIEPKDVICFFNDTTELLKQNEVGNELLKRALTKSGEISQNPNLNGFIAENWHELTFNFNAEASGSTYRAKALIPEHGYAKNSMDLGIYENGTGRAVGRYQAKYGATPKATLNYKQQGDYRGQKLLVPDGQEQYIEGSVNKMTAPDGTNSDPLSKQKAVELQRQIQNGTFKQYQTLQLAKGTAVQMGKGALVSAAITVTTEIISRYKDFKEGRISGTDYIKEIGKALGEGAVTGGATAGLMVPVTFGIKAVGGVAMATNPLITIPVTFVLGKVINKIVAPAFGRGDYKKILQEAKYYQNLMEMNNALIDALAITAQQFETFMLEYQEQLYAFQQLENENNNLRLMHINANEYMEQKNMENRMLLENLEVIKNNI